MQSPAAAAACARVRLRHRGAETGATMHPAPDHGWWCVLPRPCLHTRLPNNACRANQHVRSFSSWGPNVPNRYCERQRRPARGEAPAPGSIRRAGSSWISNHTFFNFHVIIQHEKNGGIRLVDYQIMKDATMACNSRDSSPSCHQRALSGNAVVMLPSRIEILPRPARGSTLLEIKNLVMVHRDHGAVLQPAGRTIGMRTV
jgi:hypothetical protein